MTDRPTNEEREALITGDGAGALEPDEAAELALLADLLADPSTWAEPSAGTRGRDRARGRECRADCDDAGDDASRAVRAQRRAPRRRRRIVLSAVAAAVAIAIVGATVMLTRGSTGPDFEAQLSATGLAPGADASVDITRNDAGFRITLDARGLPLLPAGEYYQAWLKNAADTLVPIGSFSSSDGRVTLWSGVSPKEFPTITVTIEAIDNDQASSGRRVLVGDCTPAEPLDVLPLRRRALRARPVSGCRPPRGSRGPVRSATWSSGVRGGTRPSSWRRCGSGHAQRRCRRFRHPCTATRKSEGSSPTSSFPPGRHGWQPRHCGIVAAACSRRGFGRPAVCRPCPHRPGNRRAAHRSRESNAGRVWAPTVDVPSESPSAALLRAPRLRRGRDHRRRQ